MRASKLLLNATQKQKPGIGIPVELTPLFLAMGVALCSATWFTYKKFRFDTSLRVGRTNPDRSGLQQVLDETKE
ncbi:LAFA_0E17326g1_1 [Lachancea sp. 'fantastica']|nr:LAFA_0E17326g1_1 [Lachancea sp. 'fantastica']